VTFFAPYKYSYLLTYLLTCTMFCSLANLMVLYDQEVTVSRDILNNQNVMSRQYC